MVILHEEFKKANFEVYDQAENAYCLINVYFPVS